MSTKILKKQTGVALILFLTILVLGLSTFILSKVKNRTDWMLSEQAQTAKVLRQAKEALIGFAATYAKTHPGQPQGYLPCPDHDGDGSGDPCGTRGHTVIGRLPWKTLGLPPLRDGSGECLWYAISGSYKNNPKQALTSDTDGLLIVRNSNEDMITGGKIVLKTNIADQTIDYAIAVIFAPGKPLIRQDGEQIRATISSTECGDNIGGGILSPDDYLDDYKINGTTYDNATGSGTLSSNSNATNFWVTSSSTQNSDFINAPLTYGTYVDKYGTEKADTGNVIFNDTLMLITPKDYEPVYTRMNYWVAKRVARCLESYAANQSRTYINQLDTSYTEEYRTKFVLEIADHVKKRVNDCKLDCNKKTKTGLIQRCESDCKKGYVSCDENLCKDEAEADLLDQCNTVCDTELKKQEYEDDAITTTNKYPISTPLPDATLARIPDTVTWEKVLGKKCFDETTGFNDYGWGWWPEWEDEVFFIVDDDHKQSALSYIWVKTGTADGYGYQKKTTLCKKGIAAPANCPITEVNNDKLTMWTKDYIDPMATDYPDIKKHNPRFLVLVAGRKINQMGTSTMQSRATETEQGKIVNYLEGSIANASPISNEDGDKEFINERTTNEFNDVVCRNSRCNTTFISSEED